MTMSMTAKNVPYKEGFGPFAPEVYRVPTAYPYRWPGGAERAAEEALAALEEMVADPGRCPQRRLHRGRADPGEGGFIVPAEGFLPGVAEFAQRHGIVFVADEIQTGFGRTGAMFACEHEGVVPDLITTAKALAGGHAAVRGHRSRGDHGRRRRRAASAAPMRATRSPARRRWRRSTLIEREDLPARARGIEALVLPRLHALASRHPSVGDARGRGAMLAIEFVQPGTTTPDPDAARAVAATANAQGVLTLTCGTFGNVIRLLPPLVITDDQLDDALSVIEHAVAGLSAR